MYFLFGIFFSIVNNVNTLAHKVEEDVPITVLFNEGTTQEQMDAVGELIRQRPEVSKIEFESGDEAWEKMKQEYSVMTLRQQTVSRMITRWLTHLTTVCT